MQTDETGADDDVEREDAEQVFASNMLKARRRYGLSQEALAHRLESEHGVRLDPTAITRIERGTRAIRLREAAVIARSLDLSVDALLISAGTVVEQLEEAERYRKRREWAHHQAQAEYEGAVASEQRLRDLYNEGRQ